MTAITLVYITLALIAALGFAFFQYLYRSPRKRKEYIFFGLRALSIFLVFLLLINPKLRSTTYEIIKPSLVFLLDDSQSMTIADSSASFQQQLLDLQNDEELNERFDISSLSFGSDLQNNDSLNFDQESSDIDQAIRRTQEIYQGKNTAIILASDGNQTVGRDYRYLQTGKNTSIFPLVIGDTTQYTDLSIQRINVNRYAFLNNKFPVELFLNYSGKDSRETELRIYAGSQVIFRQNVEFSAAKSSQIIRAEIEAGTIGVKSYRAEILSVEDEKNTANNARNFGIEVIDERTKVLLVSNMVHPDLGAIKKSIESNEQREVDIKLNNENFNYNDYQLVIIYQLNNKIILDQVDELQQPFLLILGSKTNWNYINDLQLALNKKPSNQVQEIFGIYNPNFSAFQFKDIGFNDFPPLLTNFGSLTYDESKFDVLLNQRIQGVETGDPLAGISKSEPKFGFFIGENLWRWRAESYLKNGNFEAFDDFFGKIVQNLASKERKERLEIDYENFYYGNEKLQITAQYFDQNYQFDPSAELSIRLQKKDCVENIDSDLLLKNNYFQFNGGSLPSGEYNFTITEKRSGIQKNGIFQIIDYNPELQSVSADKEGLQELATRNNSKLYYPDQYKKLKQDLLQSRQFTPVQKSHEKTVPLIDWYYLLFILLAVLAAEWFYRKYLGLI